MEPLPADRRRILVVDDDSAIRELLADILTESGYVVAEAGYGFQALERIRQTAVDLVITDIAMPEQEGLETIRRIRSEYPDLLVIAISGYQSGSYLYHAAKFGACATLKKPFTIEAVLRAVADALEPS